jgi:hypothetical protein
MLKRTLLLSGVALAYLAATRWEERPIVHPDGVLVQQIPRQINLDLSAFKHDDYLLTRRARFEIRARVLSSHRYYIGRESDLSPIDLALGWGPMSDQRTLDQIDISQSGRWYRTKYAIPAPINDQEIIRNSSNMHMIPAVNGISKQLSKLRTGDLVTLKGYLVDVDHDSGWAWRTSMTREDTGGGACEIVFVENVLIE